MSYTPNFTDPRIIRACTRAVNWVNQYLSVNNEQWLSTREIQRHLGSQSRNLGKYLKFKLLLCTDSYYDPSKAICKKYKLNLDGYNEVCTAINHRPKFQVSQQLQQQLKTGEFEYTTKSNRDFNPIQYIPKPTRRSILENNGYRFHYDIEAAAPTLLLQSAQRHQHQKYINGEIRKICKFPALEEYINNRTNIRSQIAIEASTSADVVKSVINAILQGGKLSRSSHSTILRDLQWDYDLVVRLQNSKTLTEIRNDIKALWDVLRDQFPVRYQTDSLGRNRRVSLRGTDKSGYYRSLEEQVGVVIKRYLKRDKNRHLWIHDGWSCEMIVDTSRLISEVKQQTGFVIKLDQEIFGYV